MNTSATMDDNFERGNNGQQRHGRSARRGRVRQDTPDIATLIADVEDLLQRVAYIADAEVTQVRERLVAQVAGVKEALSSQGAQIAGMARSAASATDDYLHENPWQTTGIATLVGLTLGYFLFRR